MQIGGFYAGVFRFGHGAGEVSLHLAQPLLAQKLQVASGDEGSLALHGVDEAGFFQFRVGPLGGDDGYFQVLGQPTDGGQRVPRRQSAGEDLGLDLPADLIVDRLATVVSDNEFHGSPPFVLYIHSIYSWRKMSRGIFKFFRGRFRGSVVY